MDACCKVLPKKIKSLDCYNNLAKGSNTFKLTIA